MTQNMNFSGGVRMKKSFNKKVILGLVVGGLMTSALTGCGKKATVESLFTDYKSACTDFKSADITLGMNVDGSVSIDESKSMDIKLDADLDVKAENEKGACINGKVIVNAVGVSQDIPIESYTTLDGDSALLYTYDSENDTWTKTESDVDESLNSSMLEKFNKLDYSKIYKSLVLADKTEDFNGTEAYHVSGDISGADMKDLITEISKIADEAYDTSAIEDADLSGLVISTDFYFSKKDSQLLCVKLDLSKTDFAKLADSESSTSMSFDEFSITITVNGMNNYTYEVPSDVKDNAVDYSSYSGDYFSID